MKPETLKPYSRDVEQIMFVHHTRLEDTMRKKEE